MGNNEFKKLSDAELHGDRPINIPKDLKKRVGSSYFAINSIAKVVEMFVGIIPEVLQKMLKMNDTPHHKNDEQNTAHTDQPNHINYDDTLKTILSFYKQEDTKPPLNGHTYKHDDNDNDSDEED